MPLRRGQVGDYVFDMRLGQRHVTTDGAKNPYEIGLGRYLNDGSFPFFLAGSKFSRYVANRVNCEYAHRGDELWIRTKRDIAAGEELLIKYSYDGSYWSTIFTRDQMSQVKDALLRCGPTIEEANECIRNIEIEI